MKSKLSKYALGLMMGMGLMGMNTTAQAADAISVFADIGGYSQYIWRAAAQGTGEFSVQGDVGIEHESGLSANVWFATGVGSDKEYDITIDYSGEAGDIGYSVGVIRYDYVDNPSAATEFYIGGSFDIASLTAYIGDGYNYIEGGVGSSVADLFDASLSVGYETNAKTTHTTFGASKDFDMESFTMTPSLTVGNTKAGGTEYALGVNASF